MDHSYTELSVLQSIYEAELGSSKLTQRDVARSASLSLGMANALLRRLAERGWVKLTRASTRSVSYALTPEGVKEIARRTARFFRRAAQNADLYRERLEEFLVATKQAGASTVVLAGESELDFILEYLCERHGMVFVKSADPDRARALARRAGVKLVLSELSGDGQGDGREIHLADLLASVEG
ncbi:MAG: transcriptional regulator [Rectinemataceae bacterium]